MSTGWSYQRQSGQRSCAAQAQRGSVPVFFFACMLPLLFFLLSLSLDVGAYFNERASTQKVLDDAAMYAYRFLPDQALATSAQQQFLQRYGSVKDGATASFSLDGLQLRVSRQFPLLFATTFGVSNAGLPLEVVSRVRGVPFDAFITLDATSTVAPAQSGAPWDDASWWPASSYFDAPRFSPQPNPPNTRTLTQQCYNYVFAGLKEGAIRTLDYLGGFSLNSIGVGVDNGNVFDPLEVIRTTRGVPLLPRNNQSSQDSNFISFTNNLVSTLDCAAVAEEDPLFRIPAYPSGYPNRWDVPSTARPMVLQSPFSVNSSYLPYLQAREVLWSQVARGSAGGSTSTLLLNAFGQLLQAPSVLERRGLIGSAKKVLVFFAADLPRENGVVFAPRPAVDLPRTKLSEVLTTSIFPYARQAVNSKSSGRVEIIYALLQRPSTPDLQLAADALANDLQTFFDTQRSDAGLTEKHFRARVIYSTNPQQLTEAVLAAVSIINQTAVVSQ